MTTKKSESSKSKILDTAPIQKEFYKYYEEVTIPILLQKYGDTEIHRDGLFANGRIETPFRK